MEDSTHNALFIQKNKSTQRNFHTTNTLFGKKIDRETPTLKAPDIEKLSMRSEHFLGKEM